jgi:hypothetical protein
MLSNTTSAIGWKARDFALPAVDGKTYSLADVRGPQGTLVVFICNHCPYVKARCESEHRPDRGGGGSIARDRGGDDRDHAERHRHLCRGSLRQHEGNSATIWMRAARQSG